MLAREMGYLVFFFVVWIGILYVLMTGNNDFSLYIKDLPYLVFPPLGVYGVYALVRCFILIAKA